jgi:predicted nucleic acid-binding protein
MNARRFLDTNILLYAYDLDAPEKRVIALRYVKEGWAAYGESAISVQVLQEMHVNLCKRGVSRSDAALIVRDFTNWPVVDNTLEILQAALDVQARWKLSLWDSLIITAASASGATELISEDLNHGQDYGGVRVINPFV